MTTWLVEFAPARVEVAGLTAEAAAEHAADIAANGGYDEIFRYAEITDVEPMEMEEEPPEFEDLILAQHDMERESERAMEEAAAGLPFGGSDDT